MEDVGQAAVSFLDVFVRASRYMTDGQRMDYEGMNHRFLLLCLRVFGP